MSFPHVALVGRASVLKTFVRQQKDFFKSIDPNLTSHSPPAHGLFSLRVPKDLAEMQRQIRTHH